MTIPAYISNDGAATSITVTDPINGTITVAYPTGYYEFQFNDGTGTGTATSPWHILKELADVTTTNWTYTMGLDGRLTIGYLGIGSATFVFNSSHVQSLFGSTSSTLTFSGVGTQTLTYPVFGMFVSRSRKGDSTWKHSPGFSIYQETTDSRVIGWNDGNNKHSRRLSFDFLPATQDYKTTGMVSTPARPVDASTWNTTPTALSYSAPYTALRFIEESQGTLLKLHLGALPYNGTDQYFKVYFRPDSIKRNNRFQPSIPGNEKFMTLDEVEVLLTDADSGEASYVSGAVAAIGGPNNVDTTNIFAWYRADNVVTSSGAVTTWYDSSGRGRHVSQSITAAKPFLSSSDLSYNEKPVLSFDGGDYLDASSFGLTQPFTSYIVAENQGSTYATFFDSTNSTRAIMRKVTSASLYAGSAEIESSASFNTKNATAVVWASSSTVLYSSGNVAQSSGNPGSDGIGMLRIGAGNSAVYPLTGKIAEIVFYSGMHNTATRAQILDYFETRYWTPSSLPNMHAWWSARSVITGSGNLISQVNDLSGRGRHLVQTTELRRPSYVASEPGLNNKPAILFNGAQTLLEAANNTTMPREFTVFFVLGNTTQRGMIAEHGYGSSVYVYATGNAAVYVATTPVTTTQNPVTTWATEYQQGSARYNNSDGSQPIIRGNKADLTETGHSGTTMAASNITTKWYMGNRSDLTLPHYGQIAEVIVFERKLTTDEITKVETYLTTIYGV